jgi:hypothetical protein
MIEAKRGGGGSLLVKGIIIFQKSLLTAEVCVLYTSNITELTIL